jgi:hypothetical protein
MRSLVWRFASPYDAYIAHVARLHHSVSEIRYAAERALAYEAGLSGSLRVAPGEQDAEARVQRFRESIGAAAAQMSDEQFEDFVAHLGGGQAAEVEADRARAVARLGHTTRGLQDRFAIAGQELAVLERRGYNPRRPDVARQLKANGLAPMTVAEYRHELHELGVKLGKAP